ATDKAGRTIHTTVFDSSDGVRSLPSVSGCNPMVAKSPDGKLWFAAGDGLGMVDPSHLPFNKLPPPVQIEKIVADRKRYWENLPGDAPSSPRLPPLVRDLSIDYTALSLVAPEKARFRFKLEGHDIDWRDDVDNRRQVTYNDLPPRHYRFRVIACNNSGVWNEAGASFDFSIAPKFYQTYWFQASCVAAFLALLGALYRLRLLYLTRQFNLRLEGRVSERTRIARDLHDTLLQSFQALLLKLHAVTYVLDRPAEARQSLEGVIEQARQAVTEGRNALQEMRSSTVVTNDLARAITMFGEQLATDQTGENCPEFRSAVVGASQDLAPIVRDEVDRIACEALRNAFKHACARQIEVEIHYDKRRLRLRVRDDGKGID